MLPRYIFTKVAQYSSEIISQIYDKPTKVWGMNFDHLNLCSYNSHVIINSWDYTMINSVTEFSLTQDKKKQVFISKKKGV